MNDRLWGSSGVAPPSLVHKIANEEIELEEAKHHVPRKSELGDIERQLSIKIHGAPVAHRRLPSQVSKMSSTMTSVPSISWHPTSASVSGPSSSHMRMTHFRHRGPKGLGITDCKGFGVGARQTFNHVNGAGFVTTDYEFLNRTGWKKSDGSWKKTAELGPGHYDGPLSMGCTFHWRRDLITHQQQQYLSNKKTAPVYGFGKAARSPTVKPSLGDPLGPGYTSLPDLWDPHLGHSPPRGRTFAAREPAPSESRFGGFARTAGVSGS